MFGRVGVGYRDESGNLSYELRALQFGEDVILKLGQYGEIMRFGTQLGTSIIYYRSPLV